MRISFAYGLAVLLVCRITATGQVQSNSWVCTGSGDWGVASNWSAGTVPDYTFSVVVVSNEMSKFVTISSNTAANFPGTMIVSNLTLSAAEGVNELQLTNVGSATPLEILNGLQMLRGGRLDVDNSFLQIDSSAGGGFFVNGIVSVLNGGQISAACQQMSVSNGMFFANELDVSSDPGAQGTLTLNGGTITLSSLLDIGVSTGARGTVWLMDGQLSVTNGSVTIGDSGVGAMVASNGTFFAQGVNVGAGPGSQGTLSIAGGWLVVPGNLVVGTPACSSLGAVTMSGGTLYVTNATTTAVLEMCNGTFALNGGDLTVDQLVITNSCGYFIHTGGTLTASSLVLDPNLSAVGDGIPNGWKEQYGLDPLDPTVANSDPDGSGMTVLQDYLAGTDPTKANSAFRITAISPSGADTRVYFTSVGGKYYNLERCDFLGGGWTDIVTNIPGNDGIQWVKDIAGATRTSAYYRILLNSSPVLSGGIDGDGIPYRWTQSYFGHPTGQAADSSRGIDDADRTGQNNLFKYVAGLDPTNPASVFLLSIKTVTNKLSQNNLSFTPMAPGRTYMPQFSTNLVSHNWLPLTSYSGPVTNGGEVAIIDTNPIPPQEFYRIDISLP